MTETTEKTLAEELREAAAKLREAATDAHGGPWGMSDVGIAVISADVQPYGAPCVADRLYEGDARWMVLTNPLLAEPLASWLEKVAEWADETTDLVGGLVFHVACDGVVGQEVRRCECFDHPLAVARVLNGGAR